MSTNGRPAPDYNPYPPGSAAHAGRETLLARRRAATPPRNPHPPDTLAHELEEVRLAWADLAGAMRRDVARVAYRVGRALRRK